MNLKIALLQLLPEEGLMGQLNIGKRLLLFDLDGTLLRSDKTI